MGIKIFSFFLRKHQVHFIDETQNCLISYHKVQKLAADTLPKRCMMFVLSLGYLLTVGGCSLDARITSRAKLVDTVDLNRKKPDLINGEVVTSGQYQVTGVFSEISEKTKAVNNSEWELEGVFYE